MNLYQPREDSFLLQECVRKYSKGLVLDIGTGSGIQALEATRKADRVIAVDIDNEVIEHCKNTIKNRKIEFHHSDLFSFFKNRKIRFDTIIFNPPYLPEDVKLKDITLDGGKKGYEILERFFSHANNYLNKNGKILIVFSSLTKKAKVDEIIQRNHFKAKLLEKKHIFFEDLYVYLVEREKTPAIKGVTNLAFFTKGKRGLLYTGFYKNKKVVVKAKLPSSKAIARIEIEAQHLESLNKHSIGPKFLFSAKDCLVYEFVEGVFLPEFIEKATKRDIISVLKKILDQCSTLDELHTDKEEMHNPYKHIIVTKDKKAVLVDFERAHYSQKPKNVTQFCQYLISGNMTSLLIRKGINLKKDKIINLARQYKPHETITNLNRIKNELQ